MNQKVKFIGATLIAASLLSCSKDDNTETPVDEPTNKELIQGTWEEVNVTHDGVVSNTQVICNGERELYTFINDDSFTERYFDDGCNEDFDNGTFTIDETSFTLTYQDTSIDTYNIVELNETTLKFNFNDGGVIVEETYIKVN